MHFNPPLADNNAHNFISGWSSALRSTWGIVWKEDYVVIYSSQPKPSPSFLGDGGLLPALPSIQLQMRRRSVRQSYILGSKVALGRGGERASTSMPNAMGEKLIDERVTLRRHFLDHARQEGEKSKPNLAILALGHVVGRHCEDAKSNWIRLFNGDVEEQKSTGLLDEPWKRELVMHRVAPARNDISHTVFFTFLPQFCGGSKVAGKKHKVNRKQTPYDGTWELKSKKKELTTKYLTGQTLKFTENGKISMSMLEVTLKTDIKPQKVSLCLVYKGHIDAATAYLMETIAQGAPQIIPLGEDKGMLLSERNNKLPVKITSTGPKRELEESSNQPEDNKKLCLFRRFPENLETANTGSGNVVEHDDAAAANSSNEPPTGMSHQADEPNNEVLETNKANKKFVSHTGLMASSSQNWHEHQPHTKTGPTCTAVGYPQSGALNNHAARGNEQQQQQASSENFLGNEVFTSKEDPLDEIEKLLHTENYEPIEQFGSQGAEVYNEFCKLAQLPTGMSHQADEPNNVVLEMNKANEKGVSHTGLMTSSSQNWHENQPTQLPQHPAIEVAHNDAVTQKTPFPPDMRADEFPNFALPDDDNGLMQNQMDQTPFSPDMRADEFPNFGLPDDDNGLMQNQMDQPQFQEYSPVVEPILSTEGAGSGNNDKFEDLDDNVLKHFS